MRLPRWPLPNIPAAYGPPLWLILAVLSLFSPALLEPATVLFPTFSQFSDTMVIHWPKARLMAQTWQSEQTLPLWTPLILSGMPLAANQLAMLFYPPAWLFLFLPVEPVFNLLFIFHLLGGGFGVYFLLRKYFALSGPAALLGSLTFALNGKLLAHAAGGHVSMIGAIAWLPWAVFGMLMLLEAGSARLAFKWALPVALALAMQILTHTLLLLYTVYLLAALVGWAWLTAGRAAGQRPAWQFWLAWLKPRALPLLAIPGLAVLLGLVQLWPLLELAQYSNRALSLDQAADFAVSPLQLLVGLLLPSSQTDHEHIIYSGLVPLVLAGVGLTRPHRWRWFFAALFVFALLFALGANAPIHRLFYEFVPGFRWVRTPARMLFIGTVGLSVLVGFGVEQLLQAGRPRAANPWVARLAFGLGSLAFLAGFGLAFGFNQFNRASFALALLLPLCLGLIQLKRHGHLATRRFNLLLGLLLFLDLASFAGSLMRFVPLDQALAPGRPAATYLAQQAGLFRVYSPSYSLPVQTAAANGLALADGVEPVHLAVYDRFMAQAGGYHDPSFSVTIPNFGGPLESALRQTRPDLALLGLLNVTYLAAAFPMPWPGLTLEKEIEGAFIYRNEQALPRAWLSHSLAAPRLTGPAVQITTYSANRIELAVPGPGQGQAWLIVSEIWYPGWQATVNGRPQPVEPVYELLRGVRLDGSGPFQVTLEYRPAGVIWGGPISALTGLLVIGLSLWLWR